jgi:hypothetical protein
MDYIVGLFLWGIAICMNLVVIFFVVYYIDLPIFVLFAQRKKRQVVKKCLFLLQVG